MSEMQKNHCPPETTAPKMEVHDASEGSKDIKPKLVSTAHKRLSQDEFQRKVAMVAWTKAANDMGLSDMEKEAFFGLGAKLAPHLAKAWGGLKGLATSGVLPRYASGAVPKTWANLVPRMLVGQKGIGSYMMHPVGMASTALTAGSAALPYVGGALQRAGAALGGTVGKTTGGGDQGFGNIGNIGMLGALGGGAIGAMMPGEEEYEDEDGRIRKRRGSMLAGALRGAGMGGLAGAGVGAGMDAYNSGAFKFGSAIANLEKQSVGPGGGVGGALQRAGAAFGGTVGKTTGGGGVGGTLGPNTSALNSNLAQFFAPKPTSTTYSLPGGGVGGKFIPGEPLGPGKYTGK